MIIRVLYILYIKLRFFECYGMPSRVRARWLVFLLK